MAAWLTLGNACQARTRRTPTRPAGASRRACAAHPPPRVPRLPTQARPSALHPSLLGPCRCLQWRLRVWSLVLRLVLCMLAGARLGPWEHANHDLLERLRAPRCAAGPVGIAKAAAAVAADGTGGEGAAAAPGAAAEPQGGGARAGAPDLSSNLVDKWDASTADGLVRELLRRFAPLGASDCPLFGRKFAAPENGVDLARAAHFMARDGAGAGLAPLRRRVLWFD